MQENSGQNSGFMTRLADSFFRHRWLFVLAVAIVIGVTAVALKLRKPSYKASAQTQVVTDNQELANVMGDQNNQLSWTNPAQQNVNRLNDLLGDDRPDGFVDSALRAAQLSHPISVDPRANDARYALFRKRLSVSADSDNLFSISLNWDDPSECERIVEAVQNQFIDDVSSKSQAAAVETMKFLETAMVDDERRMRAAEEALIEYKKNHSGQRLEAMSADISQLAALKNQRDTLLISSQDSALKRAALEDRLKQVKPMSISARTVTDGPTMMALRGLQSKRAGLIADGYLETSDTVQRLDRQIGMQTKRVEEESRNPSKGEIVLTTSLAENLEYQDLQQQITATKIASTTQASQMSQLNQQIASYEARVATMPAAERELNDKTRDYAILKARYENLVERHEDAKLKAKIDKVAAQSKLIPVGTIYAQSGSSKAKTMLLGVGAIFVGLLIGVGLVIFSEWTDPTLRYGADVERILELPLLGETPDTAALDQAGIGRRALRGMR